MAAVGAYRQKQGTAYTGWPSRNCLVGFLILGSGSDGLLGKKCSWIPIFIIVGVLVHLLLCCQDGKSEIWSEIRRNNDFEVYSGRMMFTGGETTFNEN